MPKKKRKKGVASKPKGSGWELEVAKDLTEKTGREFRRVPLSGAWMGGRNQAKNAGVLSGAQEGLTGDIIGPDNWPFSMECKNTAAYPRLHLMLLQNDQEVDKWIEEAHFDAVNVNKVPVLPLKRTYRGEFILVPRAVDQSWPIYCNSMTYVYGGERDLQFHGVELQVWHLIPWDAFLNNIEKFEEAANEWLTEESD
jgi:hypothetical protein